MKPNSQLQKWFGSALFGLIAAGSVAIGQAQTFTNIPIALFDTGSDPYVMTRWWGGVGFSPVWDGNQNAPTTLVQTNAGSGALQITADWTGTSGVSGNPQPQLQILGGLAGGWGGWNPNLVVSGYYYDLDFDIMFDPSSARKNDANGSFGVVNAQLAFPGWNGGDNKTVWSSGSGGYTNLGWHHVHAYIDPTLPKVDSIVGFSLQLPWQTSTGSTNAFYTNASQVQTFWIDNIIFTTNLTKPLNPPTLTLSPVAPTPGLNIQTTAGAGTYDRDSIATVNSYSWVGNGSTPVTYSITIAKYPGTNNPNCQTHIFLASGAGGAPPGTEASPDWNEPNCIFLQIQNNAAGGASGRLMWKTNDAGANDQLWGSGWIGTLDEPKGALGTWSLTFVNDTNVTLTTPSGLKTNWVFGDAASMQEYFPQGSVIAYFGFQPNADGNKGQGAVYTEVKIAGLTPAIDDRFTGGTLDPNTWVVRAGEPAGVTVAHSDTHWSLGWTLPDLGFQLQAAPGLFGLWTNLSTANAIQSGSTKSLKIMDSQLPGTKASYFRMFKPVASQLQVLLPGETNAPGTITGKIGKPDPQTIGTAFDLTINACDAAWNIATSCSDTVHITSSDAAAYVPADAPLSKGTVTFLSTGTNPFWFGSSGTWTITASDVTTNAVKSGTSTPIIIP